MQPTLPGLPPPPPPQTLEDWVRGRFWELQVPMMVLPAPSGVGVLGVSDFGQRVHFPDQTAVEFFLLGYRLGEHNQEEPSQVYQVVGSPTDEGDEGDQGG